MLVNLTPIKGYTARSERHIKAFNKEMDMHLKTPKFYEMFRKTEYVGVYYSDADEMEIHFWANQEPEYYKFFHKYDMENMTAKERIAKIDNAWTFGVADNEEQVIEFYNANRDGHFHGNHVILLREIVKGNNGGWRWHKWGNYIGTQRPMFEYLDDEPEIDRVLCFSIYKVR